LNRTQRVIWADGATLRDISAAVNDYRRASQVVDIVAADDKLYIGSELPFNHKYFDISSANAVTSSVTVHTWSGSEWVAAVDVVDETKASGGTATLAQSGIISWSLDIDRMAWGCHRDSNTIPALAGTRVFNLYWVRFTFSANLTGTTALRYIGQRFSDDDDLDDLYPALASSTLKAQFQAGKTDWKDQSFAAAEAIERDLRAKNILVRRDQVLRPELFTDASIHKTAEIIYGGLGSNWAERRKEAAEAYTRALPTKFPEIDANQNGAVDISERTITTGFMSR
jgi:hypothetical protein